MTHPQTEAISDFLFGPEVNRVRQIVEQTARITGISPKDILGKSRRANIVKARHVAQWKAHDEGFSLSAIGREFSRDHTSVMNAVRKVDAAINSKQGN